MKRNTPPKQAAPSYQSVQYRRTRRNELRALDARIDYSHSNYTFYSLIWIKTAMKVKFKDENEITLMF